MILLWGSSRMVMFERKISKCDLSRSFMKRNLIVINKSIGFSQ